MSSLTSPPDTPCIGVCSTAIGDDVCLGCARTFAEISFWAEMSAQEKDRCWANLPRRKVWMAIVRLIPGHLEILTNEAGEHARFQMRDGRVLWLALPTIRAGRREVAVRCADKSTVLEVSLESWPQQLHAFLQS